MSYVLTVPCFTSIVGRMPNLGIVRLRAPDVLGLLLTKYMCLTSVRASPLVSFSVPNVARVY